MSTEDCVLIAGAGPVGMTTGLRLAQLGIPVKLFDTQAMVPRDHRAATVHASTLHLLEEIGMAAPMIARGLESPLFQFRDRVTQKIIAEFDFGLLKDDVPHAFALQLEQHKTVEIAQALGEKIAHFELHREREVVAVSQDAEAVEITVRAPDGSEEPVRGRYLIGCDGGRSEVRKSQDIDFPGFTWDERFIIATTRFDFGAADGFQNRNYVAHPGQWCALLKVPGEQDEGIWRCLFPAATDEPDEVVLSEEWIQARYLECLPYAPPYEIVHRNLYSVHQRVAETFHCGRVLLAGDAAHVNNPLGGMGMNGGIHDGLNLADKLNQNWRGEADDRLLELYDRQRRPTARDYVQAQSIQNKETLQETDAAARQKRFDAMRQTTDDPAKHLDYVRRASLLTMLAEANAIT